MKTKLVIHRILKSIDTDSKQFLLQASFLDLALTKHQKKSITNGFFIEAGAGDGEIISNSLYFELKYQVMISH